MHLPPPPSFSLPVSGTPLPPPSALALLLAKTDCLSLHQPRALAAVAPEAATPFPPRSVLELPFSIWWRSMSSRAATRCCSSGGGEEGAGAWKQGCRNSGHGGVPELGNGGKQAASQGGSASAQAPQIRPAAVRRACYSSGAVARVT